MDRAKTLVLGLLVDGEWHTTTQIVYALRAEINQHDIRRTLVNLRDDPAVKARVSQPSYRHGRTWSYRLAEAT